MIPPITFGVPSVRYNASILSTCCYSAAPPPAPRVRKVCILRLSVRIHLRPLSDFAIGARF